MPDRLAKQVAYLDANPDIGVVSGNLQYSNHSHPTKHPTDNLDIKRILVADGCCVAHTASMIRKSVLIENNIRYEAEFTPAEDYMLWIRLIDKTMFHNLPDTLVWYRNEQTCTSHKMMSKMQNVDMNIKAIAWKNFYYIGKEPRPYKIWLKIFGLIPILKIKKYPNKTKYTLFGFIPLLSMNY
jgi:hypothetical protein